MFIVFCGHAEILTLFDSSVPFLYKMNAMKGKSSGYVKPEFVDQKKRMIWWVSKER